jgi:hypothetical protein
MMFGASTAPGDQDTMAAKHMYVLHRHPSCSRRQWLRKSKDLHIVSSFAVAGWRSALGSLLAVLSDILDGR